MEKDCTFRLEIRKNIDHGILGIAVIVTRTTSKMGVDYWGAVDYMGMREHTDTCIISAEYQRKEKRYMFPCDFHVPGLSPQN